MTYYIPEPSTWALLALGLGVLLFRTPKARRVIRSLDRSLGRER
jgi:hypothetical protein